MHREMFLSLSIFAVLAATSSAEPIKVTIQGTIGNPGDNVYQTIDATQTLPDGYIPSNTTTMSADDPNVTGSTVIDVPTSRFGIAHQFIGPNNPAFIPPHTGPWFSVPIDAPFKLSLTFQPTSQTGAGGPTIVIEGDVTGSLSGAPWNGGYTYLGGYSGVATSATLVDSASGSGVPQSLLDIFLDPGRLYVTSAVGGSTDNDDLAIMLAIDPNPTTPSVPEPSLSLMFATGLAAFQLRRVVSRQGSRRAS